MASVLSNFGLLIVEVWLLTAVALVLHRLSPRYGISLLLMYIAAMVGILTFANSATIFVEPIRGVILTLPADIIVPTVIAVVLVLYVANGTEVAQLIIFGIALIQLLVAIIFVISGLHLALPEASVQVAESTFLEFINVNTDLMIAGVVAFVCDMFVVAIIYQAGNNLLRQRLPWVTLTIALLGAVWVDALVFNGLAAIRRGDFGILLPGDLISKTWVALGLAPLVFLYLRSLTPHLTGYTVRGKRPTFDIFHNMFGGWYQKIASLEASLRWQELTSQRVLDNIQQIFWLATDEDQHARYVSPAFESMLGISATEFYGNPRSVAELVLPEEAPDVLPHWLQYAEERQEVEFRIKHPDGSLRWLRDRTYLVEDASFGIRQIIGITEDITAHKAQQALEQAIEIERGKIAFLHDLVREISHDIQTPLTTISLQVDLLQRIKNDPLRQKKYLQDLRQQTRHLARLIEYLFTLLKVESQPVELDEVVELNVLCQETVQAQRLVAENKQIALELTFTSEATPVRCHATDLQRALGNLVSNGIRYTPEGGTILIETLLANGEVQFKITDSGIGIAEDELPLIFDRFYRASNSAQIKGTGLGLAITQKIIEQHGGRIAVQSQIGAGTCFTVSLPLAQEA